MHKDSPRPPLYKIHYQLKAPRGGWKLTLKTIRFQSEAQYQSWLDTRYPTINFDRFDVSIYTRVDSSPVSYIQIYPDEI